jgi:hypothetical protein
MCFGTSMIAPTGWTTLSTNTARSMRMNCVDIGEALPATSPEPMADSTTDYAATDVETLNDSP